MKRFFKTTLAFAVVLTWFFGSTAMAQQPSKAFQGEKLFVTYCYLCHGVSGKGDGPLANKIKVAPADLTDGTKVGKKTDKELLGIIQGGKHSGFVNEEMPKWGKIIPASQIEDLVAYIRFISLSKHPLIGDSVMGEALYAKYCASCHGKNGKGDGILMNIIPMKPADHTSSERMEKMTNEELVNKVANGTSEGYMPGWKRILSDAEIAAVVSYVRILSH